MRLGHMGHKQKLSGLLLKGQSDNYRKLALYAQITNQKLVLETPMRHDYSLYCFLKANSLVAVRTFSSNPSRVTGFLIQSPTPS